MQDIKQCAMPGASNGMQSSSHDPDWESSTFDPEISFVDNAHSTKTKPVKASAIIQQIQTGRGVLGDGVLDTIQKVRLAHDECCQQINDKALRRKKKLLKEQLPGILWSGSFSHRSSQGINIPSGLVIADLDHLDDPRKIRDLFRGDPCCYVACISPSGDGVKAVYRIPANAEYFADAFQCVKARVEALTGIEPDKSGSDISRLCFLTYDPDAYHNPLCDEVSINDSSCALTEYTEYTEQTETTELQSTQRTDCVDSVNSVYSVQSGADISSIIKPYVPDKQGTSDPLIFKLAVVTKLAGLDPEQVITAWWIQAKAKCSDPFRVYAEKFTRALNIAGSKNPIKEALELARSEPPPPIAQSFDVDPRIQLLVALCFQLSKRNKNGEFFLSCRMAGALVGISHGGANLVLRQLSSDRFRILKVIKQGGPDTNKATRFAWIGGAQ